MSVFKRAGSPNYYTEFIHRGHRICRSTGKTSRRDAEAFERKLRDQVAAEADKTQESGPLTIDQACARYWIEHGRQLRDARNVQRWLTYVVKFIDKDMPLRQLGPRDVADFVQMLRDNEIGDISINRTIQTLQSVHNRAAKMWEEPMRVIGWGAYKRKEQGRTNWITQEQALRLLDALHPDTAAVVKFMLLTGVRRREAFELTWDKVNLDHRVVTITAKGGIKRDVELDAQAVELLSVQQRSGNYVFDTTNARKRFEGAKRVAELPGLRWHDLRHTCATWLGQAGAKLDVIKDQLGHSSITVTQKYRHVTTEEVREALGRLPKIVSGNVVPLKRGKD